MKFMAAAAFALLVSTAAFAQADLDQKVEQAIEKFRQGRKSSDLLIAPTRTTQDDERVKRIVDRIEKEIRESHDRTREEIRAIIRAEIQKATGKTPPPTPAPRPEPKVTPPSPAAKKVVLGITADDMTDTERKSLGLGGGIKIAAVRGPAADAGLKAGDILVELDGETVAEESIGEILAKRKPGDTVPAKVLRAKQALTFKIVLGERKD
jgi:S1-C subfamily serine protease